MTIATAPTKTSAEVRAALAEKSREFNEHQEYLGALRRRLRQTAIDGDDTSSVRDEIRRAEEREWDLGAQKTHLEQQAEQAEESERHRAAYGAQAALYRENIRYLEVRAQLLERRAEVAELESELGRLADPEAPMKKLGRRIPKLWLGPAAGTRGGIAAFHKDDRITIEPLGGVRNNGGDTVEAIREDIDRFRALAAEAHARAEGGAA